MSLVYYHMFGLILHIYYSILHLNMIRNINTKVVNWLIIFALIVFMPIVSAHPHSRTEINNHPHIHIEDEHDLKYDLDEFNDLDFQTSKNIRNNPKIVNKEKNKEIIKICNLQKFAILVLRFPFLEPLVRKLVKLPYNRFYGWFYLASQAWEWRKWSTKATIKRMFYDGLLNYQALFGENQTKGGIMVKLSRFLQRKHRRNVNRPYPKSN